VLVASHSYSFCLCITILLRCNIKRSLRSGRGFSRERVADDMFDVVATDAYVIELSVRELREFPHSLAIALPICELLVNVLNDAI
jgi:hypothetical protein